MTIPLLLRALILSARKEGPDVHIEYQHRVSVGTPREHWITKRIPMFKFTHRTAKLSHAIKAKVSSLEEYKFMYEGLCK